MERSEPTLVPEWLKNAGSPNSSSSISHSDDQTSLKLARNRSFVNSNGHEFGRSFSSDRTTSAYFRRSSSSNCSGRQRAYSSSVRPHDRDWEKDAYDPRDKDKSVVGDRRRQDFSEASGNTLLSKFERDGFRRSNSTVSVKQSDTWHKKVVTNSSSTIGTYANDVVSKGSSIGGVKKTYFGRDFPSLGAEERGSVAEVGRVPSPGLNSGIQSLPIGSSTVVNGEKWTSALAEVPVLVGSNGTGISSVQQAAPSSSVSVASGTTSSLNMAEAVAQAPNRGQTTSLLSVGTQRLEELAIKQSRQLIPVTPSTPKALALNASDRLKNKAGAPVKGDVSKASNVGKLHVLKPVREKNGTTPLVRDNLSPTGGSKPAGSTLASPSISGSVAMRGPINSPAPDRKPVLTVLEKRPTSQAQSRNEFFNSVRMKSMGSSSIAPDSPMSNSSFTLDTGTAVSPSSPGKLSEMEALYCPKTPQAGDVSSGCLCGEELSEVKGDLTRNGDACDEQKHVGNGKKHPSLDPIFSEEEEAAFLRSLGWEENADEGGLTEEEISTFFKDVTKYVNSKPSLKILQGTQPKVLSPFNSGIEAGLSSSDES